MLCIFFKGYLPAELFPFFVKAYILLLSFYFLMLFISEVKTRIVADVVQILVIGIHGIPTRCIFKILKINTIQIT